MRKVTPLIRLDIVLASLFLIILIYISAAYGPVITRLISQPEDFKQFILAYGSKSVLIFILFQAMQVIIAAIPGEFVQVAGGYIYGIWLGSLYSLLGIVMGSIIVFYIGRILGYPILKTFITPAKIERFSFFINSPRAEIIASVLFLIPGIPKDILTYLAGITPMQPLRFLIIAAVARFPGILISSYIGASFEAGQYLKVAVGSIAAASLFLLGYFYKDKIIDKLKT